MSSRPRTHAPTLRLRTTAMRAALLAALAVLATTATACPASPAPGPPAGRATPTWQLKSYAKIGYDRSFKADLLDELPATPQVVVFGGSRAMRFDAPFITQLTGRSAFNAAVQNCRPEDLYAFARYLYARDPGAKVDCFFAVQTATFADKTLSAGLLYDDRLSVAFPPELVAGQKAELGTPPVIDLMKGKRYTARGLLVWNSYDTRREAPNYSFERTLDTYIKRLLPAYRWTGPAKQTRSRDYFEKAVRLFNEHGVVPAVVIMPYHPRALKAFRAAGFQKKVDRMKAYLRDARTRVDFRVLDLLSIATFGGRPEWFYDGAHVTLGNSRLIMRHVVEAAPECFR